MDEVVESTELAVVGGGPAGLRVAEVASKAGVQIRLFEGQRGVARKFLVAGRGGLNLTHGENVEDFVTRYRGPELSSKFWKQALSEMSPNELREWAKNLGSETVEASSGRVYPYQRRAAPLLRAWLERLREQDVMISVRHLLVDLSKKDEGWELVFSTPDGLLRLKAKAVVMALGGASWPRTGSDGGWFSLCEKLGLATQPWAAANCGWEVEWPEAIARFEGEPLKNLELEVGNEKRRGELVLTSYGLEGGPIYALGPALRAMEDPVLSINFKSSLAPEVIARKMESVRRNFVEEARVRLKLPPVVGEVLTEFAGPFEESEAGKERFLDAVQGCRIPLRNPRPIAEAISSAGGISWRELDEQLMAKSCPGLFFAGEMIDWEAPTGGYLLQGCFSTGTLVGKAAARWTNLTRG